MLIMGRRVGTIHGGKQLVFALDPFFHRRSPKSHSSKRTAGRQPLRKFKKGGGNEAHPVESGFVL